MKILFITKRNYTSKDVLSDKYGRLYELPKNIHAHGHDVICVCANYYQPNHNYESNEVGLWKNFDFNGSFITSSFKYYLYLRAIIDSEKPDLIIGLSDIFHVVLSGLLSFQYKIPYVIDLYDNYESFGMARLPGFKKLFHHAVKNANGISVVSPELEERITNKHKPNGKITVIENAVNTQNFYSMDKKNARNRFNLPEQAILVGIAGSISEDRGIDILFPAFLNLLNKYNNLCLVLAGPLDKKLIIPSNPNIQYLGELSYSEIPLFLNALNIGIIFNKDDEFGKYCFPQKYYEMVSCELALVAANVGAMSRILADAPELLFQPGDCVSLSNAIEKQINEPVQVKDKVPVWRDQGNKLLSLIDNVMCNNYIKNNSQLKR